MLEHPSRNDPATMTCPVCQRPFQVVGRQRSCSTACRQAAWRRRHPAPRPSLPTPSPRVATVYQCPACETRLLGEQRCADCGVFARRLGPGGPCPHCDEPVALIDLLPMPDAVPPRTPARPRRDTLLTAPLTSSSPRTRRGPVTQRAAASSASGGRRAAPLTGNGAVGASQPGERSRRSGARLPSTTTRGPPWGTPAHPSPLWRRSTTWLTFISAPGPLAQRRSHHLARQTLAAPPAPHPPAVPAWLSSMSHDPLVGDRL